MSEQCFCLRWTNYQSNVVGDLKSLLEQEEFVDVTLACDGRRIKAHRLMLSACSNYFFCLLKENMTEHPIILLKDVKFWELESILEFIYNGQVNVMQDRLPGFIRTAESLQIKGLAAVNNNNFSSTKSYNSKVGDMYTKYQEKWKDLPRYRVPDQEYHKTDHYLQSNKKIKLENGMTGTNSNHINNDKDDVRNYKSKSPSSPNGKNCQPSHDTVVTCKKKLIKDQIENDRICETIIEQDKVNFSDISDDKAAFSVDRMSSSRSGSPEEERLDTEEDHSSHEGSITSNEGIKEGDWTTISPDQNNSLAIDVDETGLPICKVCGKVFKHQGSLVAHYQQQHSKTKIKKTNDRLDQMLRKTKNDCTRH